MSILKRAALGILGAALMLTCGAGMSQNVKAEESVQSVTSPSVTAYATTKQLKDANYFTLSDENGTGAVQKVYFGSRGTGKQTWYIAGYDAETSSLILLCDPSKPLLSNLAFDTTTGGKAFKTEWGCKYDANTYLAMVDSNHYGGSSIRQKLLKRIVNTAVFTTAEQGRLKSVKVYTMDGDMGYTVTDKAYLPAYSSKSKIYLGSSNSGVPNGPIVVAMAGAHAPEGSPYVDETNKTFWLRTAYGTNKVYVTTPGIGADKKENTATDINMVPAIHLNLSNVLFASCAKPAMAGSSIAPGMTLRYNAEQSSGSKIASSVEFTDKEIQITYDAKDGQNVFLYVAGNNGEKDFVYSRAITKSENIKGTSFHSSITSLSKCRIWLETLDTTTNLVYAKAAVRTIRIVKQPEDQFVLVMSYTGFSVEATGTNLEYQWQYSDDQGDTWENWYVVEYPTSTTPDFTFFASSEHLNGYLVRCAIKDSLGHLMYSQTVKLRVGTRMSIWKDLPLVCREKLSAVGQVKSYTANFVVDGTEVNYTWKVKKPGSDSFVDVERNETGKYTFEVSEATHGMKVFCVAEDYFGNTINSTVLTVDVMVVTNIVSQPQNLNLYCGESGTVSIKATGKNLQYQWFKRTGPLKAWGAISGATSPTYKITTGNVEETYEMRCQVTGDRNEEVYSNSVTINVEKKYTITDYSKKALIDPNRSTELWVAFDINSTPECQWQYSTDGGVTFKDIPGATERVYEFLVPPASKIDFFRCKTNRRNRTVYSQNIPVVNVSYPIILEAPVAEVTVPADGVVDLNVKAEGENLTYEWEYLTMDAYGYYLWYSVSSRYNGRSRLLYEVDSYHAYAFRCKVSDRYGHSVRTAPTKLNAIPTIKIISQTPLVVNAKLGDKVTLEVKLDGEPTWIEWIYCSKEEDRWDRYHGEGEDTCKITIPVDETTQGMAFKCYAYVHYGNVAISEPMIIQTPDLDARIYYQPREKEWARSGERAYFDVYAVGDIASYQWQYNLYYNDKGWQNINTTSAKTNHLSIITKLAQNGMLVRCVITLKNGQQLISDTSRLSLYTAPPKITKQPVNVSVKAGEKAIFKVEATGEITGYQWEYSTDQGKTWKIPTAASAKTPTFSTTTKLSQNGLKVRCKVLGEKQDPNPSGGEIFGTDTYTNAVTLTVK